MTNAKDKKDNITLRNKFAKLLNDENRPLIMEAFEWFCSLESDTARATLWQLTYDVAALDKWDTKLKIGSLGSDNISTYRNELRYQYEMLHPNFLAVDIPNGCQEAFDAFVNHTDPIVANVVYEHCWAQMYVEKSLMERSLYLLKSDKENNYFGGIRSLQFNREETVYLKHLHMQIHNLLKALYDYKQQSDSSFENRPFAEMNTLLEEASIGNFPYDMNEVDKEECGGALVQTTVEESVQTSSEFKPLTPEEILKHEDLFLSLLDDGDMNVWFQIGKLGFDLNIVNSKTSEIDEFLTIVSLLRD